MTNIKRSRTSKKLVNNKRVPFTFNKSIPSSLRYKNVNNNAESKKYKKNCACVTCQQAGRKTRSAILNKNEWIDTAEKFSTWLENKGLNYPIRMKSQSLFLSSMSRRERELYGKSHTSVSQVIYNPLSDEKLNHTVKSLLPNFFSKQMHSKYHISAGFNFDTSYDTTQNLKVGNYNIKTKPGSHKVQVREHLNGGFQIRIPKDMVTVHPRKVIHLQLTTRAYGFVYDGPVSCCEWEGAWYKYDIPPLQINDSGLVEGDIYVDFDFEQYDMPNKRLMLPVWAPGGGWENLVIFNWHASINICNGDFGHIVNHAGYSDMRYLSDDTPSADGTGVELCPELYSDYTEFHFIAFQFSTDFFSNILNSKPENLVWLSLQTGEETYLYNGPLIYDEPGNRELPGQFLNQGETISGRIMYIYRIQAPDNNNIDSKLIEFQNKHSNLTHKAAVHDKFDKIDPTQWGMGFRVNFNTDPLPPWTYGWRDRDDNFHSTVGPIKLVATEGSSNYAILSAFDSTINGHIIYVDYQEFERAKIAPMSVLHLDLLNGTYDGPVWKCATVGKYWQSYYIEGDITTKIENYPNPDVIREGDNLIIEEINNSSHCKVSDYRNPIIGYRKSHCLKKEKLVSLDTIYQDIHSKSCFDKNGNCKKDIYYYNRPRNIINKGGYFNETYNYSTNQYLTRRCNTIKQRESVIFDKKVSCNKYVSCMNCDYDASNNVICKPNGFNIKLNDTPCNINKAKCYSIYKRSNRKFNIQGAVSGGSRVQRLKRLNQKCKQKQGLKYNIF